MQTEPPKSDEAPAPARPSFSVRLLTRTGIMFPAGWSAATADIASKVLVGVTTALVLAVIYWATGLGGKVADRVWRRTVDYVVGLPKADPNVPMSILVARLAGDDGTQTERVRVSLRHALEGSRSGRAIQVLEAQRELHRGTSGDDLRDQESADAEGRRWLKETGATVLVWGEIAAKDKVFRLHFVQSAGQTERALRESYKLSESLELAQDFQDDLGLVIAAYVTKIADAAYQKSRFVGDLLDDLYARLIPLHRQLTQGSLAKTQPTCVVTGALAALAQAIGEQRGIIEKLTESMNLYGSILKEDACLNDDAFVRATKNDLGVVLKTVGEQTGHKPAFEFALKLFSETAEEITRESSPRDWAITQNNLGGVLSLLGQLDSDTARLEEAVTAFGNASKEFTRERAPTEWAMTQANLAAALHAIGRHNHDKARLGDALVSLEASSQVLTRERAPLQWATLQFTRGMTLDALAELEPDTARLEQAAESFRNAAEIFAREKADRQTQMARNNLGKVENLLAERRAKPN